MSVTTMRARPHGAEEADRAAEFLAHSAKELGEAVARQTKAEKMLGHIEALEFMASDERSAEARKAAARASQRYLDAINELAEATCEVRKLYGLREGAQARIDVWRTESATNRGNRL